MSRLPQPRSTAHASAAGEGDPGPAPGGGPSSRRSLHGAGAAARLVPEAAGLLVRQRGLWPLAAAPVGLTVLCLAGALAVVVQNVEALYDLAAGWLPVLEAGAWYTWVWIGPGKLLLHLLGYALFGLVVGLLLVLAFGFANILSAPFLDVLSQKVERLETGGLIESGESGVWGLVRESGRSIVNELRRLVFLAAIWAVIMAFGVVIPGAQLITPALLAGVTVMFLPLDYGGYTLDRRGVSFGERRAWLRRRWTTTVGFGGAAFVTFLIPGLNFLLLPILVTAGTLLVLRGGAPTGRDGA